MVMRTLVLLNKAGIISRKGNGPTSRYILPKEIGLGDIIKNVEGIDCEDISVELVDYLNTIKV
jgi:DNA-binding IscR family transcriptional regulator